MPVVPVVCKVQRPSVVWYCCCCWGRSSNTVISPSVISPSAEQAQQTCWPCSDIDESAVSYLRFMVCPTFGWPILFSNTYIFFFLFSAPIFLVSQCNMQRLSATHTFCSSNNAASSANNSLATKLSYSFPFIFTSLYILNQPSCLSIIQSAYTLYTPMSHNDSDTTRSLDRLPFHCWFVFTLTQAFLSSHTDCTHSSQTFSFFFHISFGLLYMNTPLSHTPFPSKVHNSLPTTSYGCTILLCLMTLPLLEASRDQNVFSWWR